MERLSLTRIPILLGKNNRKNILERGAILGIVVVYELNFSQRLVKSLQIVSFSAFTFISTYLMQNLLLGHKFLLLQFLPG